jgi:ComEC/Rec2-related protein
MMSACYYQTSQVPVITKKYMLHKLKFTPSFVHPLVYITFAFIIGIWLQYSSYSMLFCCLFGTACILITLGTQRGWRARCLLLTLLIASCSAGSLLLYLQQKKHYVVQKHLCAKNCSIRGIITNKEQSNQPALKTCLYFSLESVSTDNKTWNPEKGTIQIYTAKCNDLMIGDTIEICGITLRKTIGTPFDNYLLKNNIIATVFCRELMYTILHHPAVSLPRNLWNIRNTITTRLRKKFSHNTASMFLLVFLGTYFGNKKSVQTTRDLFKIWGILHFLARSGLHLVIFIVMWEFLLGFIPLPFFIKQIILALLILLYALLSWPSLPFIRALATFVLYKIGLWTNSRSSALYTLTLVCFGVLLFNPAQLLSLDFQLSFGLTFVLAWFSQQQQQKRVLAQKY